jgi:dTDP-4-dehydrorhamnose reductase
MRAWITGGSGFVGRHLVDAFDDVLAPPHAEIDVTDAEAVRRSVAGFERGAVARISAVQGVHGAPRSQDAGFGYFVAAIVRALRAGERFTVLRRLERSMTCTT